MYLLSLVCKYLFFCRLGILYQTGILMCYDAKCDVTWKLFVLQRCGLKTATRTAFAHTRNTYTSIPDTMMVEHPNCMNTSLLTNLIYSNENVLSTKLCTILDWSWSLTTRDNVGMRLNAICPNAEFVVGTSRAGQHK